MSSPTPDYSFLVRTAQQLVAADLLDQFKAGGVALPEGAAPRISRLAQADIYETLLTRVANDFATAPGCPTRLESAARQFVLTHLQATLLTWLAGATQSTAETSAVAGALGRLGLPLPN